MLLPIGLDFFGSLMISIGATGGRNQAPASAQQPAKPEGPEEQELNTAPARLQLVVVNELTGSVPKTLTEILEAGAGEARRDR